jgi:hypothetical protein
VTAPYLVPCLVELRTEFNDENETRDKDSDGWIGDAAHQKEHSDHNPDSQGRVLALDIDSTGPWPVPFADYVNFIITECRRGDETRLEYIIWDHHIYQQKNEWVKETYTGTSDPHTGHAHFSARHDHTGQNDTSAWNIWEVSMPNVDDFAQAVASKLHDDLGDPNSGISQDLNVRDTALVQKVIGGLYNDLRRDPNTTDPKGQSGLNRLFREFVREEVSALLNPPPVNQSNR